MEDRNNRSIRREDKDKEDIWDLCEVVTDKNKKCREGWDLELVCKKTCGGQSSKKPYISSSNTPVKIITLFSTEFSKNANFRQFLVLTAG